MWVIHWGLLLRLPWRTWVCPWEGQGGGSAAAWVAGVLAAPGTQGLWWLRQQEIQCSRRVWQPVLGKKLQYSCLENASPWQRSLAGDSLQCCKESDTHTKKSQTQPKWPCAHRRNNFFCLWWLCPSESWAWSCLACEDPGSTKCAGTWTASAEVMVLSESFFFFSLDSCSWQLEGLFGHSFSVALNFQALRGLPFLGSSSVVPCIRHIDGTPYWGPTL